MTGISHHNAPPRLILLALVALTLQACGKARPISAEFVDPVTGASVRYTLRPADSFTSEFDRDFRVSLLIAKETSRSPTIVEAMSS